MWSSTQHLLWDISSHRPIFDQHLIPQTDFWPATYTTASPFSIQEGVAKKQWKLFGFDYFTVIFTHDFYNSRAVISDNCNSGISYPTNWFLTRHSHHRTPPRCSIQQGAAKNLELVVFFLSFLLWFLLTFLKIHILSSRKPVIEDNSSQRPILTCRSHCSLLMTSESGGAATRITRMRQGVSNLFFSLTIFCHFIDMVVLNPRPSCSAAWLFYAIKKFQGKNCKTEDETGWKSTGGGWERRGGWEWGTGYGNVGRVG